MSTGPVEFRKIKEDFTFCLCVCICLAVLARLGSCIVSSASVDRDGTA